MDEKRIRLEENNEYIIFTYDQLKEIHLIANSHIFKNLDKNDTNNLTFLKKFTKFDNNFSSIEDLINYCHTSHYWHTIYNPPYELLDYVIDNKKYIKDNFHLIKEHLSNDCKILKLIEILVKITSFNYISFSIHHKILFLLKYFNDKKYAFPQNCCIYAASHEDLSIINFLISIKINITNDLISKAAEIGNYRMVKYCITKGFPIDNYHIYEMAIVGGNLEIFKLLHENNIISDKFEDYILAADYGRLNFIIWCIENNYIDDHLHEHILDTCIQTNRLHILDYYANDQQLRIKINIHIISKVIQYGKINIIEWFIANGIDIDHNCINAAIWYNNYDILVYLTNIGIVPNKKDIIKDCVKRADIQILRHVHKIFDCEFTDNICDVAVKNNNFECLKYLVENGAIKTKSAILEAVKYKNPVFIHYMIANNFPFNIKECLEECGENDELKSFFIVKSPNIV